MSYTHLQDRIEYLEGRVDTLKDERDDYFSKLEESQAECDELKERLAAAEADRERLTAVCNESNAVCACGCPNDEHESYGEDGESCGHDDHECVRTSLVVYYRLRDLRADRDALRAEIQKWREDRAYLGVPMTYVDQRLVDEVQTIIGDARAVKVGL